MANRQIIGCDRCKREAEGDEAKKLLGLTKIVVGREAQYSYGSTTVYGGAPKWTGEWCLACCKEVGVDKILAPRKVEGAEAQAAAAPSLEEMIREIVRQEIPQEGGG
jgi:hypothetical protein